MLRSAPVAVFISDIHFNINTLDIATKALSEALNCAEELQVPLIIAGDLNDTKAILRAEIANRLIELLSASFTPIFVLVGNHDLINEKGIEHSLNFLRPWVTIVDKPQQIMPNVFGIPYNQLNEKSLFEAKAKNCNILITHQGFMGAYMGDYIQDKTSINVDIVKDFTVFSGHYHRHQTIGTVTYIGSPYTMTFGEANDGPKGFLVLNADGSFIQRPLQLRRHVKLTVHYNELNYTNFSQIKDEDLLWLQIIGSSLELSQINKSDLLSRPNYKLELIPTEINSSSKNLSESSKNFTDSELFDNVIENSNIDENGKVRLKALWKDLVS